MDIERFRRDLHVLHQHVAQNWGRIEVTRGDSGNDTCVFVSKSELHYLEQALQVLAESPAGQEMAEQLDLLASQVAPRAAAPLGVTASSRFGTQNRGRAI